MKIPKASPSAAGRFSDLISTEPRLVARTMFGQPSAFFAGHLCCGVFGGSVFFRVGPADAELVRETPGTIPFAPMAGRPMKEYWVPPAAVLADRNLAGTWLRAAIEFTGRLPPKAGGGRTKAPHAGPARRPARP